METYFTLMAKFANYFFPLGRRVCSISNKIMKRQKG